MLEIQGPINGTGAGEEQVAVGGSGNAGYKCHSYADTSTREVKGLDTHLTLVLSSHMRPEGIDSSSRFSLYYTVIRRVDYWSACNARKRLYRNMPQARIPVVYGLQSRIIDLVSITSSGLISCRKICSTTSFSLVRRPKFDKRLWCSNYKLQ